MKNSIAIVALVVSVLSLVFSMLAFAQPKALARLAVTEREARLLEWITPRLQKVYGDFDVVPMNNPKTLEEALTPLFTIIPVTGG